MLELYYTSDGVTTGWSLQKLCVGVALGNGWVSPGGSGERPSGSDGTVGEFISVFNIVFLYLGCAWSSLLCGLFSSCGEWELLSRSGARASPCRGFFAAHGLLGTRAR